MRCASGLTCAGTVYIDASYEGYLMARARVSYTVGREGSDEYNEFYAGVIETVRDDQWPANIGTYDQAGRLLPEIQDVPMGPPGARDHKIPAYNFRLCLTDVPDNRVPIDAPGPYHPRPLCSLIPLLRTIPLNQTHRFPLLFTHPQPKNRSQ